MDKHSIRDHYVWKEKEIEEWKHDGNTKWYKVKTKILYIDYVEDYNP